jgi:hypothetical protein
MIGHLYRNEQNIKYTHIGEPFNARSMRRHLPEFTESINLKLHDPPLFLKYSDDHRKLTKVLDKCYEVSCGVKHLFSHLHQVNPAMKKEWAHVLGEPFPEIDRSDQQNFEVLNYAVRNNIGIIFLDRRGGFARSLSLQLCKQTDVWGTQYGDSNESNSHLPTKQKMDETKFKKVNIKSLRGDIASHAHRVRVYKRYLEKANIFNVYYEDIYGPNGNGQRSRPRPIRKMLEICDFLGIPKRNLDKEYVKEHSRPERKQHSANALRNIPNLEQIIQLGEDEYNLDLSWILNK